MGRVEQRIQTLLRVFSACVASSIAISFFCPAAQAELSWNGQLKYQEAQALLAKRKWPEAAIVLSPIFKEAPEDQRIVMDLAKALVFSGRREEALSVLSQASHREKGDRKANLTRRERVISRLFLTSATFQIYQDGLNFLRVKKYHQARERFEKALAAEPDNIEVLTRIGQCMVMEGDFDSAAERLRLAKKLNPYEPVIWLWLGRALQQRGERVAALEELQAADRELENSELAPVWLSEAQSAAGQKNQAIQTLENDVHTQPLHLMSLLALAKLRYGELATAKETQNTWTVRKDLQVAGSRLAQYEAQESNRTKLEGELGLDLRDPVELKNEIQALLDRVEGRLAEQPPETK
jgi:tetratricopeptide (TPR) repeat protein